MAPLSRMGRMPNIQNEKTGIKAAHDARTRAELASSVMYQYLSSKFSSFKRTSIHNICQSILAYQWKINSLKSSELNGIMASATQHDYKALLQSC